MKFDLTKVEFEQDDFNTFEDIIFDALNEENLTKERMLEYWNKLPEDLKLDVLCWGITDTPTQEDIHKWLQKNYKIC